MSQRKVRVQIFTGYHLQCDLYHRFQLSNKFACIVPNAMAFGTSRGILAHYCTKCHA